VSTASKSALYCPLHLIFGIVNYCFTYRRYDSTNLLRSFHQLLTSSWHLLRSSLPEASTGIESTRWTRLGIHKFEIPDS